MSPGTAMTNTLVNVDKKIELPVAEMQMGMTLGMLMEGFVPISIYPRWNFYFCNKSACKPFRQI